VLGSVPLVSVPLVFLASALSDLVAVVAFLAPLASLASAPWWVEMSAENDDYSIRLWSLDTFERSGFEEQTLQSLGETKSIQFGDESFGQRTFLFPQTEV
jgi:hypothetical protein